MTLSNRYAVEQAMWEVMWVVKEKNGKRIVSIQFGHDFVGARELYEKILKAKKPLTTLCCTNHGFAPPDKHRNKMRALNRQGVWWCPHCMKLRRFERRAWDEVDGKMYATEEFAYHCPMCDISHRSWHVRRWNPMAARIYEGKRSKGRKSKRGKQRRR